MNRKQLICKPYSLLLVTVLIFFAFLLLASDTIAQSGGSYEVTTFSIDAGNGESCGGNFIVAGIVGQPDAGTLIGGIYTIEGGLWPSSPRCYVYLPVALKQ